MAFSAARFIGAKVLIIGDAMLDQYQRGIVERISPEAPVPIVTVTEEEFKIGGAGNVAQNIATLGGVPTLISLCGQDVYGENMAQICAELGIDACLLPSATRQTTLKTRIMAAHQQILRVDRENSTPLCAEEFAQLTQAVDQHIDQFEVIVLSDYGKGAISKDFLAWLQQRKRADQKLILDPKTKNFPFYAHMYCMTPNTREISTGVEIPIHSREDLIAAGKKVLSQQGFQSVVITMGGDGMAVFLPGQGIFHVPTMARSVFDVTGAGDTVIAVIALGLSAGLDLLTACLIANCAGGVVVGHVGAVGITQEELAEGLRTSQDFDYDFWGELPL
ncbi:MAG: D-glycero-beta-D-manno-heptose-7-phosphate kinase [Desulfovibrionales bacterium]|nr:D-glycero-beta-D-manno-heptose-7-phosphate kinase [Desulfovibrionales bacterium]